MDSSLVFLIFQNYSSGIICPRVLYTFVQFGF